MSHRSAHPARDRKSSRSFNLSGHQAIGSSGMSTMSAMAAPESMEAGNPKATNMSTSSGSMPGEARVFGGYLPSSGVVPKFNSTIGSQQWGVRNWMTSNAPWLPSDLIDPSLENRDPVSDQSLPSNSIYFPGYRPTAAVPSECESQYPPPSDSGYGTKLSEETSMYGDPDRSLETQSLAGHMENLYIPPSVETVHRDSDMTKRTWPALPAPSEPAPSGANKLICHDCNQPVKNKSELNKHKQRHTKPWRCDFQSCPRAEEGFTSNNDRERHMLSVHKHLLNGQGMHKYYVCDMGACANGQKRWPRADNFRHHLKKVHDYPVDRDTTLERFKRQGESQSTPTELHGIGQVGAGIAPYNDRNSRMSNQLPSSWPMDSSPTSLELPQDRRTNREGAAIYSVLFQNEFQGHFPELPRRAEQQGSLPNNESSTMFPIAEMDLDPPALDASKPAMSSCPEPQDPPCIAPDKVLPHTFTRSHETGSRASVLGEQDSATKNGPSSHTEPWTWDSHNGHGPTDSPPDGPAKIPSPDGEEEGSIRVDSASSSSSEQSDADGSPEPIETENLGVGQHEEPASGELKSTPDEKQAIDIPDEEMLVLLKHFKDKGSLEKLLKQMSGPVEAKKVDNASCNGTNEGYACPHPKCTKTFNRMCELKKHRKRHERPYGCTFPQCQKTFGSKNDWKRHETSQHFQLEVWRCDVASPEQPNGTCGKACHKRETFLAHLRQVHKMDDNEELERRTDSCRIGRNCETRFWCGFCVKVIDLAQEGNNGNGAWKDRFNHIDNHFSGRQHPKQPIAEWKSVDPELPEVDPTSSPDDSPPGTPQEEPASRPVEEPMQSVDAGKSPSKKRKLDSESERSVKKRQ